MFFTLLAHHGANGRDSRREALMPGGAFESEDLLDPPGDRFVRPDRLSVSARHGTAAWTWQHAPRRKMRSRILAERDDSRAKYWRGGTRCWCCGSSARSCYGWPSGRSTADC